MSDTKAEASAEERNLLLDEFDEKLAAFNAFRKSDDAKADEKKEEGGEDKPKEGGEEEKKEGEEKGKEEETGGEGGEEELKCNQELMKTYGMEGLEKPKEMDLDICTGVSLSCCKHEDQARIYENWETNKTSENLKGRFHFHTRVRIYWAAGIQF